MNPPVFLLGEAWGQHEASIRAGFVGPSGVHLLRMLSDAGAIELTQADRGLIHRFYSEENPSLIDAVWRNHPEFHRTNVFNQRPPGNVLEEFCGIREEGIAGYPAILPSKYVRSAYQHELDRLGDELLSLNPNLVVCLGNTALWAMFGRTGITKLRGTTVVSTHCVSGFKLLSTYHPAAVIRQPSIRPTTVADLGKISTERLSPSINRPACEVWIEPTVADIEEFYEQRIRGCDLLSTDIETSGNQVTCIGFAPSSQSAIVIPFHDERQADGNYWRDAGDERNAWGIVRRILIDPSIPKLFQNGLYDIAFLLRSVGIAVRGATHDTMLLHHALQPESLKGLGYLGSLYSNHGPWKSERRIATIKRDE